MSARVSCARPDAAPVAGRIPRGQAYLSNANAKCVSGGDARARPLEVPEITTAQAGCRSVSLQTIEEVERAIDEEIAVAKRGGVKAVETEPPPHEAGARARLLRRTEVDD